jgi:hypothetical protein
MKNKAFIFIGLALLVVAVYLFTHSMSDSSSSISKVSTGEDVADIKLVKPHQVSSIQVPEANLPIFEKVASPISSISKEECATIDRNESLNLVHRQINKVAAQAYFAGSTKQEVADGIWAHLSWMDASKWYNKALDFELLNRDLPIFHSLPTASRLVSLIEDYNARLAAGEQMNYIIDLSSAKQLLWSHISLERANQALLSDEPVDNVLAKLNDALFDVPNQLLTNTQVSPISSLISSAVASKRIDVAIALLNQYPSLARFANPYEHRLRANVIASLNYELNNEQLKRDADKLLSMLDLYDTSLAFYQLPVFFDRRRLKNKLTQLKEQNINIPYQVMNEIDAPETALALWYDKESYERVVAKETECNAKKNWMQDRNLTYTQWQEFAPDDFVSDVTNSFEYNYCSIKSDAFGSLPDVEAIRSSIALIEKDMQLKGKTLAEVEFNEIDFPALSDDQRTMLSAILTRDLLRTKALSEQEVVQKLSEANLKPHTENLAVLRQIALFNGFSLWLDEIDFNDIPESYLLLNTLTEKGKFELYIQLKDKIDKSEEKHLDPFYFFIKGYSSLRSSDDFLNFNVSSNSEFTEYFLQKGISVLQHHLRASYRLKDRLESDYDDLVKDFPQLAVTHNEDYFSVKCD